MEEQPYILAKDGLLARKSGEWAKRKHHFLNNYCGITTSSMRSKWKLVYLDVMAGPGLCKIKETGEEFPGSPFVALEHDFSEYILIEGHPKLSESLRQRISKHPKAKKVKVISGDWVAMANNNELEFDKYTLVVAFIDPTGIASIPMSAMRALAQNKIDLLVTIQYRLGIVWNMNQYLKADDTALDAFLDFRDWRKWDFRDATHFGQKAIEHFSRNIETLGFIGTKHISVPETQPLYRFTLFSRHPLAEKFWNEILKIDEKGQRELGF